MASLSFKLSESEKADYEARAKRDGVALSAWLRNACNAYCAEVVVTDVTKVDALLLREAAKPKVKLAPIAEIDPAKPTGVKVELEDVGGFKIPKDIAKSRAERLGLDKKPKGASELFGHMLPQE